MAREVFVDCMERDPTLSLAAVRRDVRGLRPGATLLVIQADDPETVDAVRGWADQLGIVSSLECRPGLWYLKLYLLPDLFGDLPVCVRVERHLRKTPVLDRTHRRNSPRV